MVVELDPGRGWCSTRADSDVASTIALNRSSWNDVRFGRGSFSGMDPRDPRRKIDPSLHRHLLMMPPPAFFQTALDCHNALATGMEVSILELSEVSRWPASLHGRATERGGPPTSDTTKPEFTDNGTRKSEAEARFISTIGRRLARANLASLEVGTLEEGTAIALAANSERVGMLLPRGDPRQALFLSLAIAGAEQVSFRYRHQGFSGRVTSFCSEQELPYSDVVEELSRSGKIDPDDIRLKHLNPDAGINGMAAGQFLKYCRTEFKDTMLELNPLISPAGKDALLAPVMRLAGSARQVVPEDEVGQISVAREMFAASALFGEELLLAAGHYPKLSSRLPRLGAITAAASSRELGLREMARKAISAQTLERGSTAEGRAERGGLGMGDRAR